MSAPRLTLEAIQGAVRADRWSLTLHARGRAELRETGPEALAQALTGGELLEEYPEDPRGPSALVLGYTGDGRPLHAVCGLEAERRTSMVRRCRLCGGDTAQEYVTTETWWGGKLALVENVPAQVCQQCGEQYFTAATWRGLERLRERMPEAQRTVQVAVYAYAEAR